MQSPQKRHHHHSKHHRTSSNIQQNRRSGGEQPQAALAATSIVTAMVSPQNNNSNHQSQANQVSTNLHNLNLTQQYINAALFNVNAPSSGYFPRLVNSQQQQQPQPPLRSPKPILSPPHQQNFNSLCSSEEIELHMAEKLVENAVQRNAFQFDTDTPKRGTKYEIKPTTSSSSSSGGCADDDNKSDRITLSNSMLDSGIGLAEVQLRHKNNNLLNTNESNTTTSSSSNSDDNGGFITPPHDDDKTINKNQVKRATVVENPMFSSSPDSELINNPNESLGLDDLDMDYEQIMHYFDNLKVRRSNRRRGEMKKLETENLN